MKNGWQITGLLRRSDNGFVTNLVCEYAKVSKGYVEKQRWISTYNYTNIAEGFIPFEELTEEVLLEWAFADMGEEWKAEAEASVNKKHSQYIKGRANQIEYLSGLPF